MAWTRFPWPDKSYEYTPAALARAWKRLHAGDAEAPPDSAALVQAWIAFHAGRFEEASRLGLAQKLAGYAVANKAACIHANYLEHDQARKLARLLEVAARCEEQQQRDPANPAGYYWHAYSLGRYAQGISVVKALGEGLGQKVRASLEQAIALAPRHADAHIALGTWHAEVLDKAGSLVGSLVYGASADEAWRHFRRALALNPGSAIARIEFARALALLDADRKIGDPAGLYHEAAASVPHDAMERLDVELARSLSGEA